MPGVSRFTSTSTSCLGGGKLSLKYFEAGRLVPALLFISLFNHSLLNLYLRSHLSEIHTFKILIMPLIVPGITSNSGDPKTEWQNKLIGKTLKDSESKTDEIVRYQHCVLGATHADCYSHSRRRISLQSIVSLSRVPWSHRTLTPIGSMCTSERMAS